jgi:hypothetical protein
MGARSAIDMQARGFSTFERKKIKQRLPHL